MPTVLHPDTKLIFPSYTVVSASAGSGKTYTLTLRFVQLLLSERVPHNELPNILAITFTNNAAAEMRRRLLDYLKALSLGDPEKLDEAGGLVAMSGERLQEKARVVVDRILKNYSDLQIKTIDSFLTSVFKTSAFEVGYQPDLEILVDDRQIIPEAFEQLTRELKGNEALKLTLKQTVSLIQETRARKRPFLWDPYGQIVYQVKRIYSQLTSYGKPILSGGGLEESKLLKQRLAEQSTGLRRAITASGLRPYSKLQDDLDDIDHGRVDIVLGRTEKSKTVNVPRDRIERSRHEQHQPILDRELGLYNDVLRELIIWKARNHYKAYIDAVELVRANLDRLSHERGQILIDDVALILHRYLMGEAVADAYLMLGEQIYHFLIDEFQDTSPLQWATLKPLIENSLSQGGSLFVVGDTRQSIYGFRNADWRIMKGLKEGDGFPSARKIVHDLDTNWRSYQSIVGYTKHVFEQNVKKSDYATAAGLSGLDKVSQKLKPGHEGKGVTEVAFLKFDEENRPERAEILNLIANCLKRDFSYRDIAILTEANDRVIDIAGWLNIAGIPVLPYSSLDIRSRKTIGEMLSLLRFLDSPIDDLAFASFLLGGVLSANLSRDETRTSLEDLRALIIPATGEKYRRGLLYQQFRKAFPHLWTKYFEELYRLVGYLPVYDLVSEAYKLFRVFDLLPDEEASLVKLLEVLKSFEENERNSLKDFLEYAEEEGEATRWQVSVPREVDAVRVMTVHKARGLEFTITIVVLYDRDLRPTEYVVEEEADGVRLLKVSRDASEKVPFLKKLKDEREEADKVDTLNKLYVSLTRAKKEMYVTSLEGERDLIPSRFLTVGDGQLALRPMADTKLSDESLKLHPLHHDIRIHRGECSYERFGFLETRRGEFIHTLLSRIEYAGDDLAATVERVLRECDDQRPRGLERESIRSTLMSFLGAGGVGEIFREKPGRRVLREHELAGKDGALFRLDRVVLDPGQVVVVDFKTGGKDAVESYRSQVAAYLTLVGELLPDRSMKGLLAFVDLCKVEAVA